MISSIHVFQSAQCELRLHRDILKYFNIVYYKNLNSIRNHDFKDIAPWVISYVTMTVVLILDK